MVTRKSELEKRLERLIRLKESEELSNTRSELYLSDLDASIQACKETIAVTTFAGDYPIIEMGE